MSNLLSNQNIVEPYYANFKDTDGPEITIIGFWDMNERSGDFEEPDALFLCRCYYRTSCILPKYNLQIISCPEQALIPKDKPIICMEEKREDDVQINIKDFAHPEEATYIIGNSKYEYPSDYFPFDFNIYIDVPDSERACCAPFYGNQVVSIIWYDRYLKET